MVKSVLFLPVYGKYRTVGTFDIRRHSAINTRIIKTFSIKVKEDVRMSKPKKDANKVGKLT